MRPPAEWAAPTIWLRQADSTNARAKELAAAGAPTRTLILADQQTAGRGRQGRRWHTPPGLALALSIVVRPPRDQIGLLPLASALAVAEACESVAAVNCAIKWPNDIWIGELKVAGILIETNPRQGWAVVGIGLNANLERSDLPTELHDTATSLRIAGGEPIDQQALLASLLHALDRWLGAVDAGARDRVLAAYRQRDALRGREVGWTEAGEGRSGQAAGIDDHGNLLITLADGGTATLRAGEVHLRPEG